MELAVDLSKCGKITAPFRQTCSYSHGEAIYLKLTPDLAADAEIDEVFNDLVATIVVKDSQGKEIDNVRIDQLRRGTLRQPRTQSWVGVHDPTSSPYSFLPSSFPSSRATNAPRNFRHKPGFGRTSGGDKENMDYRPL